MSIKDPESQLGNDDPCFGNITSYFTSFLYEFLLFFINVTPVLTLISLLLRILELVFVVILADSLLFICNN